jgi:AraC family transcriptional regulator
MSDSWNPIGSGLGAEPVDFFPAEIVRHQTAHWRGVEMETIQAISHEPLEYSFKQQRHLLIAIEQGERYDGELLVEGLPTSTVRHCSHKLILVPAAKKFFGWQKPRQLTRSLCLYMDPRAGPADPDLGFAEADLRPRLLFEDPGIWQTVLKLKSQIGSANPSDHMYAEALGGLLAHELLRLHGTIPTSIVRQPWRTCRLAAAARHRFHGRASRRGDTPRHAGRSGAIEPVSFPEIVQAVLRGAASSLLDEAAH